ncbi:MAG: hypothetical protein AB7L13_08730 [Acidimicrobiia bacterium]
MRDRLVAIVLALGVLASACSGDDGGGSTTDSATPTTAPAATAAPTSTAAPSTTPTSSTPSTAAAPSTSPPSTALTNESLKPIVEQLVDSYDAVVAEILADPSVASDPGNELVRRYLGLFPQDSTFANGALGFWASEAAAGRFYRPGPRGVMYDSTVQSVELRGEAEAVAKVCTVTSIQIVDSAGAALESQGGVNGGEVVLVRVGDDWLLRDLTEAPPDDCPRPGDS